jgi:hypothetical protein
VTNARFDRMTFSDADHVAINVASIELTTAFTA